MLCVDWSRDPEFSCTRVAHLQYTLTAAQLLHPALSPTQQQQQQAAGVPPPGDDGATAASLAVRRAVELSRSLVLDHSQGLHVLDKDSIDKFLRLVQERVKFCRMRGLWGEVVDWCDMLLAFLHRDDISTKVKQ